MISDSYLYDTLGLDPNASPRDIKRAYIKKSSKIDENDVNNVNIQNLLDTAYNVLIDPSLRDIYDQHGLAVLDRISDNEYRSRSSFYDEKPKTPKTPKKQRRSIQTFDLKLSLKDLYNGCTVPLGVEIEQQCRKCKGTGLASPVKSKCKTCNGSGRVYISSDPFGTGKVSPRKCPDCHGKGIIVQKKKGSCRICLGYGIEKIKTDIEVIIQPGTRDGDRVSVEEYDDIKIAIIEKESSRFVREGNDLYARKDVTLTQALCGVSFPIKHLDGRVLLVNTEPNQVITPGKVMIIENEGFPIVGTSKKGNLCVLFDVILPNPEELTQQFKQIASSCFPPKSLDIQDADFVTLKDSSIKEFGKRERNQRETHYQDYSDYSDVEYSEEEECDFD